MTTPPQHPDRPILVPDDSVDALRARTPAFTPEWRTFEADADAGNALVELFGEQRGELRSRVNKLPEKALSEFLSTAGVELVAATPAKATLVFTVDPTAGESIVIGKGFQVSAQPATDPDAAADEGSSDAPEDEADEPTDDTSDLVIFETDRTLIGAAAEIAALRTQYRRSLVEIETFDDPEKPFLPFGKRPRPGAALLIGLAATAAPSKQLSIGITIASVPGAPPPVGRGAVSPIPTPSRPLLKWELLDGGRYEPAELIEDGTNGLYRSGVVALRLPRRWRAARPAGAADDESRFWLRLRIQHGRYAEPPRLAAIHINAVSATAARTVRNEIPLWLGDSEPGRMRLSQTPVIAGSLVLEVDDEGVEAARAIRTWKEVESFSRSGPEDAVFTLDRSSGEIAFGDGVHGAEPPQGFRNIRAAVYRVGGGRQGAVDADEISTPLTSVPFVTEVTNPQPASGGMDVESLEGAYQRGPEEIRSRGRAVTLADFAVLARRAPGAEVARAHAVAGFHPSFPGNPIPGVVGVLVVPDVQGSGPPIPDEGTLRSVAEFLSSQVAPAGVEVVAGAPRYHRVRVSASVVFAETVDVNTSLQKVLDVIDSYLHPLRGGDDGMGWPFGEPLRYASMIRHLFRRLNQHRDLLRAVPTFNFVVDGIRMASCADYAISPQGLVWADGHDIVPTVGEGR